MADFNSTAYITQLDAFGRPPPPQKLSGGRSGVTKEIVSKLDMINLDKQRRIRGDMLLPSRLGMVQLGSPTKSVKQRGIGSEDVQRWRNDVLSVNRPRVSHGQPETVENAREHARKIADMIPNYHHVYNVNSDCNDDVGTRSNSATNSLPSPLDELTVTTSHERKYSDYSSASSQKSPTPPSQSSSSDYSSIYRLQASPPDSQRSDSPFKTEMTTKSNFRSSTNVNRSSANIRKNQYESQTVTLPKQKSDLSLAEILSRKSQTNITQPKCAVGLTKQVRLTDKKPPSCGKPMASSMTNGEEQKNRQAKWREISNTLESQDLKFQTLREQLQKDLVIDQKNQIGICANCRLPMFDNEERFSIDNSFYHHRCFTCEVCGRELREQQFYLSDGRLYCKQDYLYNMDQKITKCAECKQPIQDKVLMALNRNYHPSCFRCTVCRMCLDGVQFTLDKNNQAYCLPDYHDRFAPRCHRCKKPILPDENTRETVRIVALDNDYHVDCYSCEGCGLKLTDEGEAYCYPLEKHLLCERCHLHWKRSGTDAPISDL
ncbi:LIM domain protein [Dictyocaulus viviparus]|uniref:LIM domain protein n=1 Tax=Dictyocaulus viviparus TaxID=29172 RepID=A0A0D8YBX9_DICVI|nr:LIM domain protein [Dictyocaulus viviparus]